MGAHADTTAGPRLGPLAVYSRAPRDNPDRAAVAEAVAELDQLGFGGLFVPGGLGSDILATIGRLLGHSRDLVIAAGIVNIWTNEPEQVARERARIESAHPNRLLVGLGSSHASLVGEISGGRHGRPLAEMRGYLDRLAAADPPVPRDSLFLGALGPRMLELAGERTAGAFPYFVPVEHTRRARAILGPGPLLVVEQGVLLEPDASRAREQAREGISHLLALPNYAANLGRLGYGEDDLRGGGSERLVDDLIAWGDEDAIAARVAAHRAAGADCVALQVTAAPDLAAERSAWRRLAELSTTPTRPGSGTGGRS